VKVTTSAAVVVLQPLQDDGGVEAAGIGEHDLLDVPLIFAMGFTFWAFMRTLRSGRSADYVLLGVGLALGILAKYLFALFFVALVAAALRLPRYRSQLLSARALLTPATGLLLLLPLLYGLSGSIGDAFSAVGEKVAGRGVLLALAYFAVQSAQFWLPFVAILWACLARWPAETGTSDGQPERVSGTADESFYRLVRDATLLSTAMALAAVLFLGTRITHGHYLAPVLSLLPLAIFAGIDRREQLPALALEKYRQGALAVIVGIAVVRLLLFLLASPPFCVPRCILFVDYGPVVDRLDRSDGKQTVILSNDIHIASNLLGSVPNARVIVPTDAGGLEVGLADPDDRACHLVWFRSYRGSQDRSLESALRGALRRPPLQSELATVGPVEYVTAEWQTKLLPDRGAETIIGIAAIDSTSPLCGGGGVVEPSGSVTSGHS
jgi:hypothetical protein